MLCCRSDALWGSRSLPLSLIYSTSRVELSYNNLNPILKIWSSGWLVIPEVWLMAIRFVEDSTYPSWTDVRARYIIDCGAYIWYIAPSLLKLIWSLLCQTYVAFHCGILSCFNLTSLLERYDYLGNRVHAHGKISSKYTLLLVWDWHHNFRFEQYAPLTKKLPPNMYIEYRHFSVSSEFLSHMFNR